MPERRDLAVCRRQPADDASGTPVERVRSVMAMVRAHP
jgi:hypothetical protein